MDFSLFTLVQPLVTSLLSTLLSGCDHETLWVYLAIGNFSTKNSRVGVAHACNPRTLGGRGRQISELEASLVYRVSSRTARAIEKPCLEKKNVKKNKFR